MVGLVEASGDTAGDAHLGAVPKADAVERGGEGEEVGVGDAHVAVADEGVPILDDLEGKGTATWDLNVEVAGCIGSDESAGIAHEGAVEAEVGVAHRHGAVFEEDTSREAHGADVFEVDALGEASLEREVDGGGGRGGSLVVEFGGLGSGSDGVFH